MSNLQSQNSTNFFLHLPLTPYNLRLTPYDFPLTNNSYLITILSASLSLRVLVANILKLTLGGRGGKMETTKQVLSITFF